VQRLAPLLPLRERGQEKVRRVQHRHMASNGIKTIELRGGPANGKRITIAYGHEEATIPVNDADKVGAWVVYRPTSQQCADGTEIWDQHIESELGDTGLGDL
jgi:hypothetical protein